MTDAASLEVAAAVLRGVINSELVAGLRALGVDAVGLSGVDGGLLVAMKGETAAAELARDGAAVAALGGRAAQVRECGAGIVDPPTRVVVVARDSGLDNGAVPRGPLARKWRRS